MPSSSGGKHEAGSTATPCGVIDTQPSNITQESKPAVGALQMGAGCIPGLDMPSSAVCVFWSPGLWCWSQAGQGTGPGMGSVKSVTARE